MPESGAYGSVRGALSNERPYRDRQLLESSRCRFPRDVFPQEDLGLAHRDALAPALDDLQIGATLSSDRKRLINAKIL